ncbi:MAG: metal ABC transporter ATP-binding protein [Mycoplasmatota bacterium]
MDLIEIKKLSLGYEKENVINNLSITIEEKDFICVVGPNGCGKTTFIKGLLGLLSPIKGKIVYDKSLKKNFIGYMPQETKVDANFPASVYEIVLSGCLNKLGKRPFYKKSEKDEVIRNLKLLKIHNLIDKNFCDLSGGQRQKVLLARSLCATNKLLILDEPSNNLDHKSKIELYEIAKKINKERGITIIMITHDLDHHNLIGNKILSLETKNYFYGTTDEFVRMVHND